VEFIHVVWPLVKATWAATVCCIPAVAEAGPAPVELPETVELGGSGFPLVAGQFLKKRPSEGVGPEQRKALVGVCKNTVMVETGTVPVFRREICHVPVASPLNTVTLSEAICTPIPDVPPAGVDVILVPLDGIVK
jgi:hypothetical protein